MRRALLVTVTIVFFMLAWLALDDITTGSEPNYELEWMVVALAAVWFCGLFGCRVRSIGAR